MRRTRASSRRSKSVFRARIKIEVQMNTDVVQHVRVSEAVKSVHQTR